MKFVAFSDSHNKHSQIKIPDGDVLLFAGDMTELGSAESILDFNKFLGTLPHKYKVIIAGNHDFLFEKEPKKARTFITNATYLEDSAIVIKGIKIWGSPWQPWYNDWAFNLRRGPLIKAKWDLIPKDTDILITHGPPFGYCDLTFNGDNPGCLDLLNAIKRVKPRYHVFGHIHEGYGVIKNRNTTYVNASVLDEFYRPVFKPIMFEL